MGQLYAFNRQILGPLERKAQSIEVPRPPTSLCDYRRSTSRPKLWIKNRIKHHLKVCSFLRNFYVSNTFFQMHNSTFQGQANVLTSSEKSICNVSNTVFLEVPKLEHKSKQNANLSMPAPRNIQGCYEDCWTFTTKLPALFSPVHFSQTSGASFIYSDRLRRFSSQSSLDRQTWLGDMASSCDPSGQGMATQVRDRKEMGQGTHGTRFCIILPPGCPRKTLTTTQHFPGLLSRVMNLVTTDTSQHSPEIRSILQDR